MYELDGVTYSQEDLEAAAVKYKMDYKDYLSTMQAKGLKDAGSNTDTEYEALKKAGADNEFLKIGKTRDDSYKELEKAQEYNYITIGGQTVTENEYMNEYAGGEIGVSSNVGQASDKKEKTHLVEILCRNQKGLTHLLLKNTQKATTLLF